MVHVAWYSPALW